MSIHVVLFFFFQAEDGIRDRNVTGVQTCALPIFESARRLTSRRISAATPGRTHEWRSPAHLEQGNRRDPQGHQGDADHQRWRAEIGRASCRERVWNAVEGG